VADVVEEKSRERELTIYDIEAEEENPTIYDLEEDPILDNTDIAKIEDVTGYYSGTFIDNRDGQIYKWVRLKDGKKWMSQNLNFEMSDSWCYDDKPDNCATYGRLYTWHAALSACPGGWRLPTDDEWWEMSSYYGKASNLQNGQQINKKKDAAGKAAYLALIQNGNSQFSALLGGQRFTDGVFYDLGDFGCYWSSLEQSSSHVWSYYFSSGYKTLGRSDYHKSVARSCRCLQY